MGDYTGFNFYALAPKEYIAGPIKGLVEDHLGSVDVDPKDPTSLHWEGGDVRCDSAAEMAQRLVGLMAEGVSDDEENPLPRCKFAFKLWEEPKYEWLGELHIFVPTDDGHLYFAAECDTSGNPFVDVDSIVKAVHEATDLDDAKRRIEVLAGTQVEAAWKAYVPAELPEQTVLEV